MAKKINDLQNLLALQNDELRRKDNVIAEMAEMLEEQAEKITKGRCELNACKRYIVSMPIGGKNDPLAASAAAI